MKQGREDIDCAKLKLILSKFKKDFGLSEEGRLDWTEELAKNFCLVWKQDASNEKRKVASTNIDMAEKKKKKF